MAEQSVRHTLMVTALMQCASEALNIGEDASGAAARCIGMFRRLFPDITPEELHSALAGAERRRSELAALRWVGSVPDLWVKSQTTRSAIGRTPQSAPAAISDRVPHRRPIPELTTVRRSRQDGFILRHADRFGGLLMVAFLPFQSEVVEQFFEMLIFPPIPLLHVIFSVHCKFMELIASGRLLVKTVLMRLPPPAVRLSRQRVHAVVALIDRGIRTGARLRRMTRFISNAGRFSST